MGQFVVQTVVVPAEAPRRNRRSLRLSLFDENGDPVSFGSGGAATVAARAYVDTPATPGEMWQKLLLDTVSFDTDDGFDLTNHRYVIPADGYYQILANVLTTNHIAGGISIYKNGVSVSKGSSGPASTGWVGFQLADILSCDADDYLELWGYFGGGDSLDVEEGATNYMSIVKL